jgi:uncharacterized protein (TIGR02118 family)
MIKRFEFVRRAAGVQPADFHAAWRARHAELLAARPQLGALLLRWELHHRLDEDYRRERHAAEHEAMQWDGVSVQQLADLDALAALDEALAGSAVVAGAGDDLLDPARIGVVTAAPTVIVDRPGAREHAGLRLSAIVRHNAALDLPSFHRHWREHHGALYQNVPALHEPVLAYDQNHGLDLPGAAYDGVTEQWFESLGHWIASIGVPEQTALVEPDVASFLEPASICYILSGIPTRVV